MFTCLASPLQTLPCCRPGFLDLYPCPFCTAPIHHPTPDSVPCNLQVGCSLPVSGSICRKDTENLGKRPCGAYWLDLQSHPISGTHGSVRLVPWEHWEVFPGAAGLGWGTSSPDQPETNASKEISILHCVASMAHQYTLLLHHHQTHMSLQVTCSNPPESKTGEKSHNQFDEWAIKVEYTQEPWQHNTSYCFTLPSMLAFQIYISPMKETTSTNCMMPLALEMRIPQGTLSLMCSERYWNIFLQNCSSNFKTWYQI